MMESYFYEFWEMYKKLDAWDVQPACIHPGKFLTVKINPNSGEIVLLDLRLIIGSYNFINIGVG